VLVAIMAATSPVRLPVKGFKRVAKIDISHR
jgi:hypothetical protein